MAPYSPTAQYPSGPNASVDRVESLAGRCSEPSGRGFEGSCDFAGRSTPLGEAASPAYLVAAADAAESRAASLQPAAAPSPVSAVAAKVKAPGGGGDRGPDVVTVDAGNFADAAAAARQRSIELQPTPTGSMDVDTDGEARCALIRLAVAWTIIIVLCRCLHAFRHESGFEASLSLGKFHNVG